MSQPESHLSSSAGDETVHWGESEADPSGRDLSGMTLGDFQVERILGRGGMGVVYLARQLSLNRPVALKVLRPDLLTKEAYLRRFEAEAWSAARLNHPNIVHIYSLDHVDQIRFIAMEYVQGTNLRDYIVKKGPLEIPLALSIMKQAGLAVGAAGELGLIHRDIKPENLLLTKKGQVKIADFGLCRNLDAGQTHVTQPGVTLGTPLYMSPEQAQGKALDHRSDLYSLGVTFYHMLTGVTPFRGDSALAVALKHVKDRPVSLTVHRPDIPVEIDRLVMKLMAKAPVDRYQSAAEMLHDLAKVREVLNAPSLELPDPVTLSDESRILGVSEGATARPARASGSRWRGIRVGRRTLSGLVVVSMLIGAAWGWSDRATDLLSRRAEGPATPPALWMSPDWQSLPRQADAEAQYHYAQLIAPREDREAAWLAVPGYFPNSREWATQAYIQLARSLFRRRDVTRLEALGHEISRWDQRRTLDDQLKETIQAAVKFCEEDFDGVIKGLASPTFASEMADPALLELSLEIAGQGARAASLTQASTNAGLKLREIQGRLLTQLYQIEAREHPWRFRSG